MCIECDCEIRVKSTDDVMTLRQGSATLIPAMITDYDVAPINGKSFIHDAFIDNIDRSVAGKLLRFMIALDRIYKISLFTDRLPSTTY